jgi:putative NADH-flavin reductase
MKILVFGATGKTGMEVVKQALEKGNEVRAFVRNPQKMTLSNEKLTLVQGDVTDAGAVMSAVVDVDGVIIALGASADMQADIVMAEGTANIISAMQQHGVKKVVIQSSYPMSGYEDGISFLKQAGMGDEQIAMIRPVLDDKKKQIELTLASGLEFVIVKPMMLTDEAGTGKYRVTENPEIKPGDKISRADVADFMIKALTDSQLVGKIITIAY